MSALSIQVPFPVFAGTDGQPLENGYIWIGTVNLNPQVNPIAVYWDAALTIPAAQPLRTLNGYVSRSGTPAQIYIDGVNFSILVQDSKGSMVYNFPDGSGISPNASGIFYDPAGTGAIETTVQAKLRQIVNTENYNTIDNYDTARTALAGNYNDMLVQSDIDNTETLLGSELTHLRTQKPAWYSFPRLMKIISSYDTAVNPVINIVGFGSSVGVGATLPDPATQAPVAVFSSTLKSVIDPGNIYNFVTYNDSVNGSTFSQAADALDAAVAAGHTPNICVLAYGMNDGAVAIFNSGQTYPSVYSTIMQFVTKARGYGADVVLMTTPHPNTDIYVYEMPSVIPQNYPTFVAAPVSPTQLIPPASASNITADWLGTGQNITVAHRHYRVNQAMRQAATDAGIAVIDVERYWFKAVAKFDVAPLFNTGETVHPNLLGHQNSYWLAIYEFLQAMGWQTGQEGQEARLNGLIGINNASPQAVLDVIPPYPNVTTPPFQVSARVGQTDGAGIKAATVVWKIDPSNGDLVGYAAKTTDSTLIEVYRHNYTMDGTGTTVAIVDVTEKYKSSSSRVQYGAVYNVIGAQTLITLPNNSTGTIYVNALNNGIGIQRARVEWVSISNAVTFGTIENVIAGLGAVFTGPTATGLIAQIAVSAAATNVTWQIVINSGF